MRGVPSPVRPAQPGGGTGALGWASSAHPDRLACHRRGQAIWRTIPRACLLHASRHSCAASLLLGRAVPLCGTLTRHTHAARPRPHVRSCACRKPGDDSPTWPRPPPPAAQLAIRPLASAACGARAWRRSAPCARRWQPSRACASACLRPPAAPPWPLPPRRPGGGRPAPPPPPPGWAPTRTPASAPAGPAAGSGSATRSSGEGWVRPGRCGVGGWVRAKYGRGLVRMSEGREGARSCIHGVDLGAVRRRDGAHGDDVSAGGGVASGSWGVACVCCLTTKGFRDGPVK